VGPLARVGDLEPVVGPDAGEELEPRVHGARPLGSPALAGMAVMDRQGGTPLPADQEFSLVGD
jgi:hypothetical protein